MSFLLNLLAVCFIYHFQECCSHYSSWTTNRMRHKLFAMNRELIKDAIQKVKSIEHMKTLYSRTHSYQIADRIFFIRKKFARMMRVYTIAIDNIQKKHYHFLLKCMEEINYLNMDIDHLVEMVTEFEKYHASDLIDIGGLTVPADMLSPSNIGGDLAKLLENGGLPGAGGSPGGGFIPPLPSSSDIPGFPQGLPTKPPSVPNAPGNSGGQPAGPHGAGGRPVVLRAPPGARSISGGRIRGNGRPNSFPVPAYVPGSNSIRKAYSVFNIPRDPYY